MPWCIFTGSTPCNGGHGVPTLYKWHGDVIAKGSLASLYVKHKTGCKMLWQTKLEANRVLVPLFMHQGSLPMHCEPCEKIALSVPDHHRDCYRCCLKNQLSLISLQKVVSGAVLHHSDNDLSFVFICKYVWLDISVHKMYKYVTK